MKSKCIKVPTAYGVKLYFVVEKISQSLRFILWCFKKSWCLKLLNQFFPVERMKLSVWHCTFLIIIWLTIIMIITYRFWVIKDLIQMFKSYHFRDCDMPSLYLSGAKYWPEYEFTFRTTGTPLVVIVRVSCLILFFSINYFVQLCTYGIFHCSLFFSICVRFRIIQVYCVLFLEWNFQIYWYNSS